MNTPKIETRLKAQQNGILLDFTEVDRLKTAGEPLTATETFIHENDPAGVEESKKFLDGLRAVIKEANKQGELPETSKEAGK